MKLDTPEDRVSAYMMRKIDEDKLQKPDKRLIKRWAKIWGLMLNYHSPNQAVEAHMKICEEEGEPISTRTAWYDLKHATNIWGNLQEVSYQSTLVLLKEYAMQGLQLAATGKKAKEIVRFIAEIREISRELYMLAGAEKEESGAKSNFILVVNQADGGQMTIDLSDYEVLPDEMASNIIDAFQENQNDTENFLKIVEEGGNIDGE